MKSSILSTVLVLLLVLYAYSKSRGADGNAYTSNLDIPYKKAGPTEPHPPKAFMLDIYSRPGETSRGIVVFVHGGGWMGGDKANVQKNSRIIDFFIKQRYVFACVNFRLPQREGSPRVTYHDQATDIAAAMKWLSLNSAKYGSDAQHFVLFGFSSGAHLAGLVGTDARYLTAEGLPLTAIERDILMDVHTYDIPAAIASMKNSSLEHAIPLMHFLFGETISEQNAASPATYAAHSGKAPFLLISAGVKDGVAQNVTNINSEAFAAILRRNGHPASHVHFASKDHTSLVMEFGKDGDQVATEIKKFIDQQNTSPR